MSRQHQWDVLATEYAKVKDDLRERFLHPAIEEVILEECVGAQSLLDYGCGPGDLALRLMHHFERITLTDSAPAAVDIARQRLAQSAKVLTLDQFSTSRELFDVALLSLVLTTIEADNDALQIFRTLRRCLSPIGRLVIATTHPCFTFRALATVPYRESSGSYRVPIGTEIDVIEYHRPLDELLNLISSAGLRIVRAKEVYDSPDYYRHLNEEPHRFAGILPIFLIAVCAAAMNE
jgi:ubiquinone/menaquinone biosynthesis C-methylase UbiE